MKKKVQQEVKKLIVNLQLNCTIKEFQDQVNWYSISYSQKLSEEFIREFKDKVNWYSISESQKLSEEFIREFKDKVNWDYISGYQKLSEEFIREFSDKVDWNYISCYQKLSEAFIEEFKNKINIDVQLNSHHVKKTLEQKRKEVQEYAEKYDLKYDDKYLYAYRDHDCWGRGAWNKTISYKSGIYYQDWHCDLNPDNENSFGLGIWPEGNTPVKIKIQDWGTIVNHDAKGKARVCGFQIIYKNSLKVLDFILPLMYIIREG
jgi:hypothetical protein